jgi:hypothetical protein
MPIGMMAVSQTSTSSEALVGIGLIPSSNVGGARPTTSSIERRATWASTMVVSWLGIPLANLPPPRESPTAPYFERLVLAPANSYRRPYTIQASNQQQNTLDSLHCISRTISERRRRVNPPPRQLPPARQAERRRARFGERRFEGLERYRRCECVLEEWRRQE